ncbi:MULTISPECIES: DoxX family protein [Bacteroidales]|uniref:DoxX family membrane protein n=1 Tax=Lepagella muris TaxID=3032870 RepID=A0AC61RDW4_9BACT|nr:MULTISPECIES: DoxX family protein [Bacteroidales]ROT03734.1 DoxX family membrane protein [Muribaculaceae bacterium Isolate-037 (Harlan)]TGY77089.1 DoxX family membrane protein [Lepagella muris]THG48986.1 DoxX family membrane protein [Bacteroidales bacterium]TKC55371.1 DoxX family membrane protein [Bacteroidales bacterium]
MRKFNLSKLIKRTYFRFTGYSYTNLGRLFLRLFVGIMLMQFGIRQILNFEDMRYCFPSVFFMGSELSLLVMIAIELFCSLFIMIGFLTRFMIIPPFIAMIVAEHYLLSDYVGDASYLLDWQQQGYLPIMFLGIYFFLMLVGPGKISIDYFLSLHIIHNENKSEGELEEV